jgi:alkanesulfonate monooxygenase SsuD/methylene tetrahydromethanopterin reductase-like flavin-dependent oxidoreductase (luciferase family)
VGEIGLQIPHTGAQATPEFVRQWCRLADEAGYGSLWGVDHMVMPEGVLSRGGQHEAETGIHDAATPLVDDDYPDFGRPSRFSFVCVQAKR